MRMLSLAVLEEWELCMMWSPYWKLQLLDTCRDATCLHCVTDEATHLALTDQVNHWLQCTVELVGLVPPR